MPLPLARGGGEKSEIREENSKLIRNRRDKNGGEKGVKRKKKGKKRKRKLKLVKKFRLRHTLEFCYGEENSERKI